MFKKIAIKGMRFNKIVSALTEERVVVEDEMRDLNDGAAILSYSSTNNLFRLSIKHPKVGMKTLSHIPILRNHFEQIFSVEDNTIYLGDLRWCSKKSDEQLNLELIDNNFSVTSCTFINKADFLPSIVFEDRKKSLLIKLLDANGYIAQENALDDKDKGKITFFRDGGDIYICIPGMNTQSQINLDEFEYCPHDQTLTREKVIDAPRPIQTRLIISLKDKTLSRTVDGSDTSSPIEIVRYDHEQVVDNLGRRWSVRDNPEHKYIRAVFSNSENSKRMCPSEQIIKAIETMNKQGFNYVKMYTHSSSNPFEILAFHGTNGKTAVNSIFKNGIQAPSRDLAVIKGVETLQGASGSGEMKSKLEDFNSGLYNADNFSDALFFAKQQCGDDGIYAFLVSNRTEETRADQMHGKREGIFVEDSGRSAYFDASFTKKMRGKGSYFVVAEGETLFKESQPGCVLFFSKQHLDISRLLKETKLDAFSEVNKLTDNQDGSFSLGNYTFSTDHGEHFLDLELNKPTDCVCQDSRSVDLMIVLIKRVKDNLFVIEEAGKPDTYFRLPRESVIKYYQSKMGVPEAGIGTERVALATTSKHEEASQAGMKYTKVDAFFNKPKEYGAVLLTSFPDVIDETRHGCVKLEDDEDNSYGFNAPFEINGKQYIVTNIELFNEQSFYCNGKILLAIPKRDAEDATEVRSSEIPCLMIKGQKVGILDKEVFNGSTIGTSSHHYVCL